jgi:hypothetical protein
MRCAVLLFLFLVGGINTCAQTEVEFKDENIGCLHLAKREIVVTSNEEYKEVTNSVSAHPDCASYVWPTFDFEKQTLLGFLVNAKGCSEPAYSKSVSKLNGQVTFMIKVKENGMCKVNQQKMFWITILKHEGNKINFIIERN